jgi:hypothetical protein
MFFLIFFTHIIIYVRERDGPGKRSLQSDPLYSICLLALVKKPDKASKVGGLEWSDSDRSPDLRHLDGQKNIFGVFNVF